MKEKIIQIDWEGPLSIKQISRRNDDNNDFGIYQIYGRHPVYGNDALLYIGIAKDQTFAVRINQHDYWLNDIDNGEIKIYIGLLYDEHGKQLRKGSEEISLSEELLIYVHTPAYNKVGKESINNKLIKSNDYCLSSKNVMVEAFKQA